MLLRSLSARCLYVTHGFSFSSQQAMDSAFNVQPSVMSPYWNARGIAINHWYKVKVTLDPNLPKGEIIRQDPEGEAGFANTPSGGQFPRKWGFGGATIDPEHSGIRKEYIEDKE